MVRKRLRGSALRLYPGVALDCAFASGGACGGVEAPNWNACKPSCGNTVLDAGQLTFLKDADDRVGSYSLTHTSVPPAVRSCTASWTS